MVWLMVEDVFFVVHLPILKKYVLGVVMDTLKLKNAKSNEKS